MKTLVASVAAAFSFTAAAQLSQLPNLPDFDVSRLDVNSAESGSLIVGTGEMLPVGAMRFSLAGHYENSPLLSFNDQGEVTGSLLSDRYTIHMVGAWAPFDWLEFGADIPMIAAQFGDVSTGSFELVRRGIGSPTGIVRAGLLSQRKGSFADVALQLGVRVPVGTDGAFANDGRIGLSPKLMIGRNMFDMFRAGLEIGARWRDGAGLLPDGAGNQLLLAGVISTGARDGLQGEISAKTSLTFEGALGAVELLAGARYPIGLMELWVLAGPGLGQEQTPGTPAWRVLVGANFGNGLGLGAPVSGAPAPVQGSDLAPRTPTDIPSQPMPQASTTPTPSSTATATATGPSVTVPVAGGTTVQAGPTGVTATGTVPTNVPVVGGATVQAGTNGVTVSGSGVTVQSGANGVTTVSGGGTTVQTTGNTITVGGTTVPTGGVTVPVGATGTAGATGSAITTGTRSGASVAPTPQPPPAASATITEEPNPSPANYANPYGAGATGSTSGSETEEEMTRPAPRSP